MSEGRPALPPPGAHGGDGVRLAAGLGLAPDDVIDLSASLNPVAPPVAAIVSKHLDSLGAYPDPLDATASLASAIGVDASRVLLTNGGAEAIALVAAELGRGRVDDPEFSLYRRHLPVVEAGAPRFASNPNNPTGRLAGPQDRASVWDEAFYPLATGTWTRGDADHGAFVVGSLTKLLACPGLRAGYVMAPDRASAVALGRRQPQWSVNSLVCSALPELLDDLDLPAIARHVARLRADLVAVLEGHGLAAEPSDANFVLVGAARGLREALLPHGLVVRDCASFGLPDHVRIAVPAEAGIERLDRALGACR